MLSVVPAPEQDIAAPTFDDFYALYPRKIARKHAERMWARLTPEAQHAAIVGLADWRRVWEWECSRDEGRADYIPHPGTWLNGERWTDELPVQFRRRDTGRSAVADGPTANEPRQALPEHVRQMIAKVRARG